MSNGEPIESTQFPGQLEDFSPPPTSEQTKSAAPVLASRLDVLDLIVKFELIGEESENLISNLRKEMAGQSERLLSGILIERSYLTEDELETVVLARYLLACGKLTMAQLELVMDEIKDTRAPLWVSLVAKGWLKMSDVV